MLLLNADAAPVRWRDQGGTDAKGYRYEYSYEYGRYMYLLYRVLVLVQYRTVFVFFLDERCFTACTSTGTSTSTSTVLFYKIWKSRNVLNTK